MLVDRMSRMSAQNAETLCHELALIAGETARQLVDARDMYGAAVWSGRYQGYVDVARWLSETAVGRSGECVPSNVQAAADVALRQAGVSE